MNNLFFYTRTEKNEKGEEKSYLDSFNVNKILRTVGKDEGIVVILDDLHERPVENPVQEGKKFVMKRMRDIFQSEIHLNEEDSAKFIKKFNV